MEKSVTTAQVMEVKKMAHEKGVSREAFQRLLKEGAFARVLDGALPTPSVPDGMIVRRVRVNRALTPAEAISATGRVQYVNAEVLATMPRGEGEEVDVYFFQAKRFVPVAEYDRELASKGLVADPCAVVAVNAADPAFADTHPNGVQWGTNSYASFRRWRGKREVHVDRDGPGWHDYWWFGGVRKVVATP